jgi:hypothetical protein
VLKLRARPADGRSVTIQLRLWHVLALAAVIVFSSGVAVGAFVVERTPEKVVVTVEAGPSSSELARFEAEANVRAAEARVRAAIPAVEAYYADNNTYARMSLGNLQATYDQGIKDVSIVRADDRTYCVESTVGDYTASKDGPAADILSGGCSE